MSQQQTIPDVNLDTDAIVAEAMAAAQLDDFGPYGFKVAMEKLLWSLQHEARLTPLGRFIQRQRIVDILVNNLRMQDHLCRYPEIEQEQIREPLFVVGLPRTGTTMLHRTIAADARMFAPLWYEVRNPSPWPQWDYCSKDPRITEAEAQVQAMLESSPELAAIHPMDALGPDEEIMLLEHSFHSTMPESAARVPAYAAWLETQDQTLAYEFLKKQLQFLQWQKKSSGQRGERWALKAPHHLHFMDLLFKVFPDAKVVQTHRDPLETIPSLASLIYSCWIIASDDVDACELGRHWAEKFATGTRHTMAVRESLPSERFLDLWFSDTISQPLAEIEKIYDFAGMQLTPAAHQAMTEWQQHNRRELRPTHDYTLEQFGLSDDGLKSMFAEYRERFIVGR
jgi:hypothetical protein